MNINDLDKLPLLVSAPSADRPILTNHLQVTKENQIKHTGARKKTQHVDKDNMDNLLYNGRKCESVNGYLHNCSNLQTLSGCDQNLLQLQSNK